MGVPFTGTYREHTIAGAFPSLRQWNAARCRESLPIHLIRPVLTCFPKVRVNNLNHLVMILFCLARASASPRGAPGTHLRPPTARFQRRLADGRRRFDIMMPRS